MPVIATCRGKERGGLFNGTIEDEIEILEAAAGTARDTSTSTTGTRDPLPPADVIASYHNFEETPADLVDIVDRAFDEQRGKLQRSQPR